MRIDAFTHVLSDAYLRRVLELLRARGDRTARDYEGMLFSDPTLTNLDERWKLMDELEAKLGDDYRQVLVMAHTSAEHEDPDTALDLARIGNEELAGLVADHPDRFVGWVAQTALQAGERNLEMIRGAIEDGALGVQIYTSIQGRALDQPDYEPFFALMAELDRPIWIHPNRTVQWSDFPLSEPESLYGLYSRLGWPSDTAITMCRLVYAGYLERWPNLKIITHHSGGTVPMLAGRVKLTTGFRAVEGGEAPTALKHPPLEYLRRFYCDTANFGNPIALRAALEFFGPDQVLFGTDFGFSPLFAPETIDDMETVVQDEALKQQLYEDNARRVLRLDELATVSA
jgi:predicted TIM-barrel fold metal-dependent hydrolase